MKTLVNRHLFTQTGVDSGALTMHGMVIHTFREAGEYQIALLWNNETIRRFPLIVDNSAEAMQVDIDLVALQRHDTHHGAEEQFMLKPGGNTVFYVSRGAGGYAVLATRLGEQQPREEGQGKRPERTPTPAPFDSRELRDGDMFAVTLLRPGAYSLTNAPGRAKGELVVAYPKQRTRYDPTPEPVTVECTDKGFVPSRVELQPMQGLVFRVLTPSRIRIDLSKPDDGSQGPRPERLAGWRKPTVAQREKRSK